MPETGPAGSLSAPAIVTQGREAAEAYDLPGPGQNFQHEMNRWGAGGVLALLAEVPEAGAAFYGLPYAKDAHESVLLRWGGDRLAEFDWNFATPRMFPPEMACFDADGDGEDELIAACYYGSGTGVSIYELHVVEKNPDGTLTDYTLPEGLWQEQISALLRLDELGGRYFLSLGRELVELVPDFPQITEGEQSPSAGWIAEFLFLPEESIIVLRGAADCWHTTYYVANYSAEVCYEDGIFTLWNFHLYS